MNVRVYSKSIKNNKKKLTEKLKKKVNDSCIGVN